MSSWRLQPRRGRSARRSQANAGFSLVELMVSMVLFSIVSAGSLGLFTISTRQANLTRQLQEEEFAIRLDLATIQALNDRYTCASGTCLIDSNGEPPGQNDYYPTTTANQSSFASLCSSGGLAGKTTSPTSASGLVGLINATTPPTAFTNLGISRTTLEDGSSPNANRYTVTWKGSDGSVLRQISLTPTTAAWCP
ncbi:MAG: type II secretion system protein J [Cyanobium sp.]